MIKSMTGYGRFQDTIDGKDITVEIKSVNHRYFEFSSRISRSCGFIEDKLKSFVQSQVSRGKIDVHVSMVSLDDGAMEVELNRSLAKGYVDALRTLASEFGLTDDVTVSSVARYSDIFTVRRAPEDEDAVWNAVKTVAQKALDSFVAMREVEGAKLRADVLSRADTIIAAVEKVEAGSKETLEAYRQRLYNKLIEVLETKSIDEQRILTECAIFADRIAVDEETVRLRSHIDQLRVVLDSDEPSGRKLDFIVQEMNRETNTIGSKSQSSSIAHIVVDMKAEIEKIREQIQNIE